MHLTRYLDTRRFIDEAFPALLNDEAQANLLIANALRGREVDTSGWFVATVKDGAGSVLLSAMCTPPFNIVLYATRNTIDDAAVRCLCREMHGAGYSVPGVLALEGLAEAFAAHYADLAGAQIDPAHIMNVRELTEAPVLPDAPGRFRALTEDDLFFAPFWEQAFNLECGMRAAGIPEYLAGVRERIAADRHFIWEHGVPVSQAYHSRSTPNDAVVSGVYTPPPYRGMGYATSCVAHLSRLLLARGARRCCLFADAANATSNYVYGKIGYRLVCRMSEVRFQQAVKSPWPEGEHG